MDCPKCGDFQSSLMTECTRCGHKLKKRRRKVGAEGGGATTVMAPHQASSEVADQPPAAEPPRRPALGFPWSPAKARWLLFATALLLGSSLALAASYWIQWVFDGAPGVIAVKPRLAVALAWAAGVNAVCSMGCWFMMVWWLNSVFGDLSRPPERGAPGLTTPRWAVVGMFIPLYSLWHLHNLARQLIEWSDPSRYPAVPVALDDALGGYREASPAVVERRVDTPRWLGPAWVVCMALTSFAGLIARPFGSSEPVARGLATLALMSPSAVLSALVALHVSTRLDELFSRARHKRSEDAAIPPEQPLALGALAASQLGVASTGIAVIEGLALEATAVRIALWLLAVGGVLVFFAARRVGSVRPAVLGAMVVAPLGGLLWVLAAAHAQLGATVRGSESVSRLYGELNDLIKTIETGDIPTDPAAETQKLRALWRALDAAVEATPNHTTLGIKCSADHLASGEIATLDAVPFFRAEIGSVAQAEAKLAAMTRARDAVSPHAVSMLRACLEAQRVSSESISRLETKLSASSAYKNYSALHEHAEAQLVLLQAEKALGAASEAERPAAVAAVRKAMANELTKRRMLAAPAAGQQERSGEPVPLFDARQGQETSVFLPRLAPRGHPAPAKPMLKTSYQGPLGAMIAYAPPPPVRGSNLPTVLWVAGDDIDEDLGAAAELSTKGAWVYVATMRGQLDNPGRPELDYGEIADLEAARVALVAMPHVNPDRLIVAGVEAGATRALLLASAGVPATGVIAACPDLSQPASVSPMLTGRERELRDVRRFIDHVKAPTFVVTPSDHILDADELAAQAKAEGRRVTALALMMAPCEPSVLANLVADRIEKEGHSWVKGVTLAVDQVDIDEVEGRLLPR